MEECFFRGKSMKKTSFLSVILLLLFIFTLGTFLRFHELGEESIWVDEAFTDHYISGSWSDILTFLKKDVHPIGFYALEYWWTEHFGNSEFSLRFLPSIFGSLSILFFFFAVRELYDRKTALLSMLFFSLSYTFILYSQEAKMYAQFIFFFLVVFLFLVMFLRKPSWLNGVLLAIANIGLLHTHILSVPIIAIEVFLYVLAYILFKKHGEDIFFLFFKKKAHYDLSRFLLTMSFVAFSYFFWLPVFYYQFHRLFLDMLPLKFNQKFGFDGFYMVMLIAVIGVAAAVSACFYFSSNKRLYLQVKNFLARLSFSKAFFVIIFVVWLGVNLFYHRHFFGNLFYVRYLLFLFPFWHIIMARKLFTMPRRAFCLLLILYLAVTSFVLFQYYSLDGKEQWREASEYVTKEAGVNDVLLFHTVGHTHWSFNYYYSGLVPQVKLKSKNDVMKISSALEGKEQAFLILSHNYETKEYFKEVMDRQYWLVESKEFIGVKVYRYRVS